MELWIRAIQATCNREACRSDAYPNFNVVGDQYPGFIWDFWQHLNHNLTPMKFDRDTRV